MFLFKSPWHRVGRHSWDCCQSFGLHESDKNSQCIVKIRIETFSNHTKTHSMIQCYEISNQITPPDCQKRDTHVLSKAHGQCPSKSAHRHYCQSSFSFKSSALPIECNLPAMPSCCHLFQASLSSSWHNIFTCLVRTTCNVVAPQPLLSHWNSIRQRSMILALAAFLFAA